MTARCVFLLESSRTRFLSLHSPIQSGINCTDNDCSKSAFLKLVRSTQISTGMWDCLFFQFYDPPSYVPKLNLSM